MKCIDNFTDYMVSEDGFVYSRLTRNRFGSHVRKTPMRLRLGINKKTGYCSVSLGSQKNGLMKRLLIHRLVATSFIPNPENKPEVNHKNGIKTDNRACNLEWVTRSENQKHAYKIGLKEIRLGESARNVKITNDMVLEIRASIGSSQKVLSEKFNISQSTVSLIISRKRWQHL